MIGSWDNWYFIGFAGVHEDGEETGEGTGEVEVGLEDVVEDLEAEEATSEVDHQVSVFFGVQVATMWARLCGRKV